MYFYCKYHLKNFSQKLKPFFNHPSGFNPCTYYVILHNIKNILKYIHNYKNTIHQQPTNTNYIIIFINKLYWDNYYNTVTNKIKLKCGLIKKRNRRDKNLQDKYLFATLHIYFFFYINSKHNLLVFIHLN